MKGEGYIFVIPVTSVTGRDGRRRAPRCPHRTVREPK